MGELISPVAGVWNQSFQRVVDGSRNVFEWLICNTGRDDGSQIGREEIRREKDRRGEKRREEKRRASQLPKQFQRSPRQNRIHGRGLCATAALIAKSVAPFPKVNGKPGQWHRAMDTRNSPRTRPNGSGRLPTSSRRRRITARNRVPSLLVSSPRTESHRTLTRFSVHVTVHECFVRTNK
jgi:hypothetical protein